jgi:hypothetical protein
VVQDFTEVTVIALKEEAESYELQWPLQNRPHRTYSKDSSKDTQKKDWEENQGRAWRKSVWIWDEKELEIRLGCCE